MVLLKARPHQWGAGKTHVLNDQRDRTLCGKTRENCPGEMLIGQARQADCQGCLNVMESQARREREEAEWQARRRNQERERQAESNRWWADYDEYLDTTWWADKREKVLARESHVCQGCRWRNHRATHVHHLKYPRNCSPGSEEWIKQEKLFDLVAVCDECHHDLHPGKDF
jgi:hypothetical protein